ncbi:MAG: polyprenyl synthetase family protein [Planctomycetes bacterium]|nr:polyprenyl synthetase family protein [Planctomycetota bacterium]
MTLVPQLTFAEMAAPARPVIEAALNASSQPAPGCPERLAEAMRYSLLAPAKRLRPILVTMAAEACDGTIERALPAACAVEMVHTYSLIHDDLPAMDDDDLRRGRPTCHVVYGEAMAILAGDALLARAFEVLAREISPAEVAARAVALLAAAAGPAALVGGQADDLTSAGQGDVMSLESIHARKTGAMFLVSLQLGGLTAGATAEQMTALVGYGRAMGLAFQIMDDLLDVSGSEQALGKRVGKDVDRGKLTFPALLGVGESRRRAEALVAEACAALAPLGPQGAGLEALARYVLERDR